MAGLRCPTCRAEVSPFAERCGRCGADPEVTIIELDAIDELPTLGGPRPSGASRRRGRRWWLYAVIAGIVAWGAGATIVSVSNGSDDLDDEAARKSAASSTSMTTATTARRDPARTTTTVAAILPEAPVLGELTGLRLLAATPGALMDIDLDTGDIVEHALDGHIAGADEHGLLLAFAGDLSWRPFPLELGVTVSLGSGTGETWLLEEGDGVWVGDSRDPAAGPFEFRLLDLADGSQRASATLPLDAYPVGVSGDELVVSAAGRVYTIDRTGAIADRALGYAYAAGGGYAIVRHCDEELRCGTARVDLRTGASTDLPDLFDDRYIGISWISPTGLVVFSRFGPDGGVFVADADGVRPLADPRQPGQDGVSWSSFSPDGRWVALAANGIVWVGSTAGEGDGTYIQIRGGLADGRVVLVPTTSP